jgi:hypothetical protein
MPTRLYFFLKDRSIELVAAFGAENRQAVRPGGARTIDVPAVTRISVLLNDRLSHINIDAIAKNQDI